MSGPEHGGMGLGHLAKTVIIDEVSRVSGAMGAMVQAPQPGVAKILHFGELPEVIFRVDEFGPLTCNRRRCSPRCDSSPWTAPTAPATAPRSA
jgi:hypothetical protein